MSGICHLHLWDQLKHSSYDAGLPQLTSEHLNEIRWQLALISPTLQEYIIDVPYGNNGCKSTGAQTADDAGNKHLGGHSSFNLL